MKNFQRFLGISFLILVVFSFSGCLGNTQIDILSPGDKQMKIVSESGTLKALGVNLKQKGTHLLQKDDGEILLLYSNFVDLDDPEHLNKEVTVEGTFIKGKEGEKDTIAVERIQSFDGGTSRKTYRDEEFGFKVTYDPVLKPTKSQSRIAFRSEGNPHQTIVISEITLPSGMNFESYLNDILKIPAGERSAISVGPSDIEGYKVMSKDESLADVYANIFSTVYNFSHLSQNTATQNEYREYFYDIIDSFMLLTDEEDKEAPDKNLEKAEEAKDPEITAETIEVPAVIEETPVASEPIESEVVEEVVESKPEEEEVPIAEEEPALISEKVVEEPVEHVEVQEGTTEPPEESTSDDPHSIIINYLKANINTIAPESSDAVWTATQYEFVEPNYVYLEYNDGIEYRKLLMSYTMNDDVVTTTEIGYFKPGTTMDWDTISGSNAAAGYEREIYTEENGDTKTFTLLEGYRYFESSKYSFKIQFPANWYYAGSGGIYNFASTPVESLNVLISLEVLDSAAPTSGTAKEVNGLTLYIGEENGKIVVYIAKDETRSYKILADAEYASIAETMASTIIHE